MTLGFVLPSVALLTLSLVVGIGRWDPPIKVTVRALTVLASVASGTVAVVVTAIVVGFVLGPARRTEVIEWCRIVPLHHQVGRIEGSLAVVATLIMAVRVGLVVYRRRAATRGTAGRRVSILDTAEPVAYAAPGRPGCVVVSTGLLSVLDPRERQVVFAHERAHLRQGHHWYLLLGSLAVAIVPFLKPLVERLRLATERCADEEAVAVLGGDRRLVATTIVKAALTKTAFSGVVPAFNGGPVVARVNSLIGVPPSAGTTRLGLATITVGTLLSVGASLVQLHHLSVVVDHLCYG